MTNQNVVQAYFSQICKEYKRLRELNYAAAEMLRSMSKNDFAADLERELDASMSRLAFAALGDFHQDNAPLQ